MTKTFFHRETGNPCVFDNDANLSDWPEFQEFPIPKVVGQEDIILTRAAALQISDWMAASDRVMTEEQRTYRQALRDITDQTAFIEGRYGDVVFPTKPVDPGFGGR